MIVIDPAQQRGSVKAVHGVNRGPVDYNWYFDFRPWFRRWRIPSVRTHDMAFDAYDTCDLHHLFPNPQADPDDPASYRFELTDDVLRAVRDTGAEIYFRLGESIEHQPRMMWNRPERWTPPLIARVCLNIVRHYNEGWAGGFDWGIRHWEFWNEPNGPKNWTGTVEQFFELHHAVARALKGHDSSLQVGLAGLSSGILDSDAEKTKSWREGLENCVRQGVPIDFVSWHRYIDTLEQIPASALQTRAYLDRIGLSHAQSHLGEWAYRAFLETDSGPVSLFKSRDLKRYDLMRKLGRLQRSGHGTAIIFGTFAQLQDLPVDLAQYYCADMSRSFGLFGDHGLPNLRAQAFEAFWPFLDGQRVEARSERPDVAVLAVSQTDGRLRIGIANTDARLIQIPLAIQSGGNWTLRRMTVVDDEHEGQEVMPPMVDPATSTVALPICGAGLIVLEVDTSGSESAFRTQAAPKAKSAPAGDW